MFGAGCAKQVEQRASLGRIRLSRRRRRYDHGRKGLNGIAKHRCHLEHSVEIIRRRNLCQVRWKQVLRENRRRRVAVILRYRLRVVIGLVNIDRVIFDAYERKLSRHVTHCDGIQRLLVGQVQRSLSWSLAARVGGRDAITQCTALITLSVQCTGSRGLH